MTIRRPSRAEDHARGGCCELLTLTAVHAAAPQGAFRERDVGDPLTIGRVIDESAGHGTKEGAKLVCWSVVNVQLSAQGFADGEDLFSIATDGGSRERERPVGKLHRLRVEHAKGKCSLRDAPERRCGVNHLIEEVKLAVTAPALAMHGGRELGQKLTDGAAIQIALPDLPQATGKADHLSIGRDGVLSPQRCDVVRREFYELVNAPT